MKRYKIKKRRSKSVFRRGTKVHKKNRIISMRGGTRL